MKMKATFAFLAILELKKIDISAVHHFWDFFKWGDLMVSFYSRWFFALGLRQSVRYFVALEVLGTRYPDERCLGPSGFEAGYRFSNLV
ncbi:hypothetical protein OUZ56_033888 [Daphnia magna]|uniref:Uncharacterized protein n=1 Tax=Daphnia magna TaxID=35525 RepID=A0ABR0BB87_9CRUS|nr:hypothetical protein OUZ56_033888 [Daphnia magna]